jgi:hypothetical protein
MELIRAIPAAAAEPASIAVGIVQQSGKEDKIPAVATESATIAAETFEANNVLKIRSTPPAKPADRKVPASFAGAIRASANQYHRDGRAAIRDSAQKPDAERVLDTCVLYDLEALVRRGEAVAEVTATGARTKFGSSKGPMVAG